MTKELNRRNFMKYAGATGAAVGLAGCSGGGGSGGSGGSGDTGGTSTDASGGSGDSTSTDASSGGGSDGERPMKWMTPAWAGREGQAEKFTEMTGIEIERTIGGNATTQQRLLSGGISSFDVFCLDTASVGAVVSDNDGGMTVSTDDLDGWNPDLTSSLFTNPTERLDYLGQQAQTVLDILWADQSSGELQFPPHVYNFDAIGYNPKQVDDVSTWSSLFDDQYEGQVAMGATASVTVPESIMHLLDNDQIDGEIGQLNNPTVEQIDAAVDFLVKQKEAGQFRSTWSAYGTSVNLMSSEEAIIGDLWQPAAMDVRRAGTPCTYATMSDGIQGYRYWYGGVAPTNPGASNRNNVDEVHTLIDDIHYGAWFPGYIQGWGYSVPHYPNTDLVRDGSDESGEGMGPEYYDWSYDGGATYTPLSETQFQDEALFDPLKYEWSMEEGSSSSDGVTRDSGPIEERIDRIGFFQIWPDNSEHMLDRWQDFTTA
jgi:spermidine/putrescine-binding protein